MNKNESTFLAWITRMSLIERWALMHSFQSENISEHSHQVAVIAHLLAVIRNKRYGGNLIPEKAATVAIYHEVSETLVQDINHKTKYSNPEITSAVKALEDLAEQKCLNTLPDDLKGEFEDLLVQKRVDPEYKAIVKAADILQAYIKALNELRFNNDEFHHVKDGLEDRIEELSNSMPEVKDFLNLFIGSCTTTLDGIA
ncbi:5'-deoxynucleotidase [Vibrio parahaemolyticus]|uniref:5'-deoxynucleotidase n=1 Tax=Vibrio parahaemolyticus TaxID=670 RepID=UPI0004726B6D|nr:5'-deoxynucleotidase [Vibrio parahaemolyticus]EGQ8011479.1 5'-deoxynucleotidase [Vibrio parahaemolyticus]EHH2420556.1 5'-deoxynucleotidase [Vibrio parahaemolyticus]EHK2868517.1 5'-deoxynucleotidase [Vibrio parahaemolyticus]EKA7371662.1 5'-deoxynucleotidase [Vibrio parahaemolyticus]ELA3124996.1 5'-deoxynucleotidase [Vibrio parahaemolyticus]